MKVQPTVVIEPDDPNISVDDSFRQLNPPSPEPLRQKKYLVSEESTKSKLVEALRFT